MDNVGVHSIHHPATVDVCSTAALERVTACAAFGCRGLPCDIFACLNELRHACDVHLNPLDLGTARAIAIGRLGGPYLFIASRLITVVVDRRRRRGTAVGVAQPVVEA